MTAHQKAALRTAGIFFDTWLLLALAAADFPPPRGFVLLLLLLLLLACAFLVYLRVPVYLRWRAEGAKGRILRAARDGFLGGGAIALLSLFRPGEPSIQPTLVDRLIGMGVLIGLGVGNALAAYGFGSWFFRRRRNWTANRLCLVNHEIASKNVRTNLSRCLCPLWSENE